MTALHELSLTEVAVALRRRELTAEAVACAALDRARVLQPKLNCFIAIDEEDVLADARAADAEAAQGRWRGPLHGVPLAHKDMYYRTGRVSTCGSAIRRDWVADHDSTALSRLRAAGALQLGTLNMAQFAFGPTGHNVHWGHCRNPWNPAHVTGGSSSGSGAAVGARIVYGALGSDTGGSIRLPAGLCGVAGMKPTQGRVSRHGAMPLSFTLDTVGPLARTVADCALLTRIIAGHDPDDPTTAREPVPDYLAWLGAPVNGMRVGIPRGYFDRDVHPEIAAALDETARVFRSLGCRTVDVTMPDLDAWSAATNAIMWPEAASLHGPWIRTRADDYMPQVRARIEMGAAMPAAAYLDALKFRAIALEQFAASVYADADVLLAPVAPFPVPTLTETDVADSDRMSAVLGDMTRFTRPFNLIGVPTLSVPGGFSRNGLPIGFQLAGRPWAESLLFRLGDAYQQVTDWHRRTPTD
jgi:aspartyl-tRNA(Asn)/glutamyl-tRNA(Gln) amidotransferase subunit A